MDSKRSLLSDARLEEDDTRLLFWLFAAAKKKGAEWRLSP
jgi:hypothetical protein